MKEPGRKPPIAVLRQLRKEVGFHCPAPTANGVCGSPFLTWHHFDPEWRVEKHHRPEGMIALCREHADKADNGSYTDDQLRRFKKRDLGDLVKVRGEFSWMRNKLVARVGGNFYVDNQIILAVTGLPMIWFERNEHDELMLNYRHLSGNRAVIENNVWMIETDDHMDVVAPPNGRTLEVRHDDGRFSVSFREHSDADALASAYEIANGGDVPLEPADYPVTVVEIVRTSKEGQFQLHPDRMVLPGNNSVSGCWFIGSRVAIEVTLPLPQRGITPAQLSAINEARTLYNRS